MKSDMQNALSSVTEVAIFAWSLLELLLTRVLPVAAFFTGHLLLQLGSLLTSIVTPAPRRRQRKLRRAEYDYWDVAQAEELAEEDETVQAVNEGDDDQNTSESLKLSTNEELVEEVENVQQAVNEIDDDQKTSERLKLSTDEELGKSQQIISGLKLPSLIEVDEEEDADPPAPSAVYQHVEPPRKSAPREEQVTGDLHNTTNDGQARGSDDGVVAESSPSVVTGLQDTANEEHVTDALHNTANDGQARGSNDGAVAESSPSDVRKVDLSPPPDVCEQSDQNLVAEAKPSSAEAIGAEEQHVSPKEEGSAGARDLKPSDGRTTSEEATRPREMLMRKSSGRWMRGLPPSLSQVKRSLMQRSRRASPSPHTTSPATTAPSPSPFQKQQRSSRKSASPTIR